MGIYIQKNNSIFEFLSHSRDHEIHVNGKFIKINKTKTNLNLIQHSAHELHI